MSYRHLWQEGSAVDLPVGKVVCVGRNYAQHARELNNPVPTEPLLFMKPATALVALAPRFAIPTDRGAVHHETEIAVLIGRELSRCRDEEVRDAIAGIGLALDLTLRDLQNDLKEMGQPWEKAKAFDGACPMSPFVPAAHFAALTDIPLSLQVNGQLRQSGSSAQMLFPIIPLITYITRFFTLRAGDIVLTGTPAGVGALHPGDQLLLRLGDALVLETLVLETPALETAATEAGE